MDLEENAAKLERKAEIAEMVYDMAPGSGGNETLRDKLIDVMYENEQLKAENSIFRETLNKGIWFYETVCGGWEESVKAVSGEYGTGGREG